MKDTATCPGCGLQLPGTDAIADERFNASAECWQLYGELTAYTLSLNDIRFPHQHAVDAYAAQHAGGSARSISTIFGLIGLYLALEKGYTGRQVQLAHIELAGKNKQWPSLELPAQRGNITVQDVLQAAAGEPREAMLRQWMASVWNAWRSQQGYIRDISRRFLGV